LEDVMNRRRFIRSIAVAGAGAALAGSHRVAWADMDGAATTKRFSEQRWALDNIIRANGIDWDQPRSNFTIRSGNALQTMARLADHKIEAVSIPFKDKSIPAWFHLPPGYRDGKVPVVIAIPGMDSFKEVNVALATAGCSGASQSYRSTDRGNTKARCSAFMYRCRIGSTLVLQSWTGC
jgi:hypothetical protein